ncbi:hypothetical protein [Streptomyces marincola]|uniref:hypothetical protein n=1 Tax=Streptomyces marincola TaxID=2878388 RepID=UPI001CF4C5FD|nr:hypothetical protein [Streptomyces marincola]UCM88820.1 hypothetical protein LC193_13140 [Streptomyces marincola]
MRRPHRLAPVAALVAVAALGGCLTVEPEERPGKPVAPAATDAPRTVPPEGGDADEPPSGHAVPSAERPAAGTPGADPEPGAPTGEAPRSSPRAQPPAPPPAARPPEPAPEPEPNPAPEPEPQPEPPPAPEPQPEPPPPSPTAEPAPSEPPPEDGS